MPPLFIEDCVSTFLFFFFTFSAIMRTVFFVFPWTFLIVLFYFRLFFRSGYCSLFFPVVQVFFSVECFVVGVRHLFLCVGYVVGTVEFGEMNFEYFALYVLWVWMDGKDGS